MEDKDWKGCVIHVKGGKIKVTSTEGDNNKVVTRNMTDAELFLIENMTDYIIY